MNKIRLKKELALHRGNKMKPNYAKIGRDVKADWRTVKKYFKEPETERKKRTYTSVLDPFEAEIRGLAASVGASFSGIRFCLSEQKIVDVKYSTLTAFCRKKGISLLPEPNIHVRYDTDAGKQLQVDWKENLKLRLKNGEVYQFNVFTATLGFSRKHFFLLSETKTTSDFIRCMNDVLVSLGGTVARVLTDNMPAVVQCTYDTASGKSVRKKNPAILMWEKDSNIKIDLCRPRSPQTKGKDESANRFIDWLAPYDGMLESKEDVKRVIAEIQDAANAQLNPSIMMSPQALFAMKEKQALGPLPNMSLLRSYENSLVPCRVANTMLISYRKKYYSVPKEYVGKTVFVADDGKIVRIYYNNIEICSHEMQEKKINYRKEDYVEGLRASIKEKCGEEELEKLAEENLRRFGEDGR